MKISKAMWFTLFLLAFALIEFFILLYDLTHPFRNEFKLASYETTISQRAVTAFPFSFETSFLYFMNYETDNVAKGILYGAVPNIYAENRKLMLANPETAKQLAAIEQDENIAAIDTADARIAIVIDDMGISSKHTNEILSLRLPLTLSYLPYGNVNKEMVASAISQGYETMAHIPMMPHSKQDLAPVTLSPDMSEEEITEKLTTMLERFDGVGIKGINNHMGSLFTEDEKAMTAVMKVLKDKNLYFLDSRTTKNSVGKWMAEDNGIKSIARDVFLDNEDNYEYIIKQLNEAQKIAEKKGFAVAIGHPKTHTYEAIRDWAATLDRAHTQLVFLSELVK